MLKQIAVFLWKLLKTKTVWVNILGVALQIVNEGSGQVIPVQAAMGLQLVINVIVRAITSKPVSAK